MVLTTCSRLWCLGHPSPLRSGQLAYTGTKYKALACVGILLGWDVEVPIRIVLIMLSMAMNLVEHHGGRTNTVVNAGMLVTALRPLDPPRVLVTILGDETRS